jgi:uncharacterized protein (DUF362 family)
MGRRALVVGGGLATLGVAAYGVLRNRHRPRASVFLAAGQRYDGPLARAIRDGLLAVGVTAGQVAGRRVLLKPNLVEPTRACPQMTTHPAVVVAAAEVFRQWGATVTVGEAPGHLRDTELALVESGLAEALRDAQLTFDDLNYDEIAAVTNAGRASRLAEIYFPRAVLEADLVVSLPKLKTHHWMGLTASMKNLYGTLPGIKYGWPKNVLHHAGIPETVLDINATLPRTLTVVDAIDCMEGDGPIMGSLKPLGVVAVGANLPAVDATLARVMGLLPQRVEYLRLAADRLGPIDDRRIDQRGERWETVRSPFAMLRQPHLDWLRDPAVLTS